MGPPERTTRRWLTCRRRTARTLTIFGAIEVDIDAELAQLGPTGYRLLRKRDTLF